MSTETYRLSEAVVRLRAAAPELTELQLTRRLQNWTDAKLLWPVSAPHSGRGVHRRFDLHELYKAAVLLEVARYQVPAGILQVLSDIFDGMREDPPRRPTSGEPWHQQIQVQQGLRRYWKDALEQRRLVHLTMAPQPDTPPQVLLGYQPDMPPGAVSMVAVNLTALLRRVG